MLARMYVKLCDVSPGFRKFTRRYMYQFLAHQYQKDDWSLMNYGYVDLEPGAIPPHLEAEDEENRYCIQLYHHVANAIDLTGLDVLEVGSGRGGGASYIQRYLKPRAMVGVDYSENAVTLCSRHHCVDGLRFEHGDAENLPFEDHSFDAVVNVESSHCYGSMEKFLAEVARVLRPGGHFLFTDFRNREQLPELDAQLRATGMTLLAQRDITPNVLEALNRDHDHRIDQIQRGAPSILAKLVKEFAGVKGARIYKQFADGSVIYQSFVLQKSAEGV